MAELLPLETLLHIFSYLPDGALTECACVCQQWQVAAETLTFADLHIDSTDLEDLPRIIHSSRSAGRCFHLRALYFKVILPKYSVAARGHYENHDDRDGNNRVFSQVITSLFEILSSWPDYDHNMSLEIYARSPSDWQAEPDWNIRRIRQERGYAFPDVELLHRRYKSSYLQLTGNVIMSNVKCITSLKVLGCDCFRNIAPGAVSEMVAHLPRLQLINARLRAKERKDAAMHDSLGDFPGTNWPSSLRHLQLGYEEQPFEEQASSLSNPGPNDLCLALYQMTQRLENVYLSQIMIGPEVFWPADANNITPFWPNLLKFSMSYTYTPSSGFNPVRGTLGSEGDLSPGSPDSYPDATDDSVEPPDNKQQSPILRLVSKNLEELYLAAGRAAQHMPRLSSMDLDVCIFHSPSTQYYFRYDATLGTATWMRSSDYRVSNEVQEAWDVAAKGHGHGQICTEVRSLDSSLCP